MSQPTILIGRRGSVRWVENFLETFFTRRPTFRIWGGRNRQPNAPSLLLGALRMDFRLEIFTKEPSIAEPSSCAGIRMYEI
jgi:hypothetical protein